MPLGNIDLTPQLIQAVRDSVDIVSIASDHTRLKRSGKRHEGLCPLHKEKTPSFSVDPDENLFYCFGCSTGGDAIKLHMLLSGDDFPTAIESLAMRFGVPLPSRPERSRRRERGPDVGSALEAAAEFFTDQLRRNRTARAYLAERQIPGEMIKRYGLGYAPDSWDALRNALTPEVPLKALEAAGLVGRSQRTGKPYDRFRHRLMFPIHTASGRLVGFGGRTLGDDRAKYINTAETEQFHKSNLLYGLPQAKKEIREGGRVLLVEGYFDVLGAATAGIGWAVANMGTSLTRNQAKLLARFADDVVVGYDGDEAGDTAHRRSLPILLAEGLGVRRARFGTGHDPDSLRLEAGPERVRQAIEEAEDAVTAEITRIVPRDGGDPRQQARAASAVVELLKPIPDAVERFGYGRIAAGRLGVPVDMIARRLAGKGGEEPPPASDQQPEGRLQEQGEQRILALLLSGEAELPPPDELPPPEAFLDPRCRNIYRAFRTLYGERGAENPPSARAVASAMDSEGAAIDALAQIMIGGSQSAGDTAFSDLLDKLTRRWRQQRLKELAREIDEAQRERDSVRLQRLLDEKVALSRRLHPLA